MSLPQALTQDQLDSEWQRLRALLDSDGVHACQRAIAIESDAAARNQVYRFAIRKLGGGSGATPKDLDAMIELGMAAIEHAHATSKLDPERSALWLDEANVSAFNLAANLCDCWGDGDSRRREHFEAGLKFADQALILRRALKKGPGPFSMAHWMRGKHLLSLGRASESAESFAMSLSFEEKLASAKGLPSQPSALSPGSLLLSYAFLGLAKIRAGSPDGQSVFDTAKELLQAHVENGDSGTRDDAKAFLEQLAEAARRN